MIENEFNTSDYERSRMEERRYKFQGESPKPLPIQEQQRRLDHFRDTVNKVIKRERSLWKVVGKTPILGLLVYGSWVWGDAHENSDLDTYGITNTEIKTNRDLFRFKEKLYKRGIGVYVDIIFTTNVYDSVFIDNLRNGNNELIGPKYEIFSPYQGVVDLFQRK